MAEAERIAAEYARRSASIPPDRYSPATPAQPLLRQSRERAVLTALRRSGLLRLAGRRILDVGCGTGQWLADFETWGPIVPAWRGSTCSRTGSRSRGHA